MPAKGKTRKVSPEILSEREEKVIEKIERQRIV